MVKELQELITDSTDEVDRYEYEVKQIFAEEEAKPEELVQGMKIKAQNYQEQIKKHFNHQRCGE